MQVDAGGEQLHDYAGQLPGQRLAEVAGGERSS